VKMTDVPFCAKYRLTKRSTVFGGRDVNVFRRISRRVFDPIVCLPDERNVRKRLKNNIFFFRDETFKNRAIHVYNNTYLADLFPVRNEHRGVL